MGNRDQEKRNDGEAGILSFLNNQPLWHGTPDNGELLRLLTAAACPIVCVGHRQYESGPDWHELCEEKAIEAFKILRPMMEVPSC